jgi:hypothetical protein
MVQIIHIIKKRSFIRNIEYPYIAHSIKIPIKYDLEGKLHYLDYELNMILNFINIKIIFLTHEQYAVYT